jgi:hypothetical protein
MLEISVNYMLSARTRFSHLHETKFAHVFKTYSILYEVKRTSFKRN